jgi:gluconokinase
MIAVVMGAAGAGKTTVGRALADRLQSRFVDADDLHPSSNVAKMARGESLDDADRAPWLAQIHELLLKAAETKGDLVLACSALREQYRLELARGVPGLRWVFLQAPRTLLHSRLSTRQRHFAGPALLDAQLAVLEPPRDAIVADASKPVATLVEEIARALTTAAES